MEDEKGQPSFTIKTNGLAIIQDGNDTFLADFESNNVASLGDVIITDSANNTAYGTMTVAAKIEREEYTKRRYRKNKLDNSS